MEQFNSPMELTTLVLVLSIGLYVLLYWRSQTEAKLQFQKPNRRKTDQPSVHKRRVTDRADVENLVLNHLFENEDTDTRHTTTH